MDIEQAEMIVSEYGQLLSTTEPSIYGIAISRLPYNKEEIKSAIQTLLLTVEKSDKKIHDGLIQAYVYLALFISDEKAMLAENGRGILENENTLSQNAVDEIRDIKNIDDLELANQAVQTINGIKSDMENLMNEIRLLIP